MEPSNLSINSSQQPASQFFQKSAASLKNWGCRVCQQLHHHREILHTYSSTTKIGLFIAVNALFFVVFRAAVNYLEERANRTNPEKTVLNDKIATVLVGVVITGLNIGLSKLGRYQLPALILYATSISSMAVYVIFKKHQPLLAPIQEEISSQLRQISEHRDTLTQTRTELQQQENEINTRLNNPPASTSIPASTDDQQELARVQGELAQIAQTEQNLSQLEGTLQQEAAVVEEVLRDSNVVSNNPGTPERVTQLRRGLQQRLQRVLPSSPLNTSTPPQSRLPSTPVHTSTAGITGTPGNSTAPSSPASQNQTTGSDAGGSTLDANPPSTPTRTNSTTTDELNPTENQNRTDQVPPQPVDPQRVLQTPQSMTSWLLTGAIQHFGPAVIQNAPNIVGSLWGMIRG